ncbi:MAG: hypothetical protein M0R06_02560 [Sphaerochaeta sp.]|jgi:hypothetical protein|nr:hypothetical protein [Sphaerochaeta sp.]
MATITTRFDATTNRDLLKEGGVRKIFDTTVREAQVFYKELVNDGKTGDEYVRDQRLAGLGAAVEIQEGQNIPIDVPVLGTAKTYTQREFGSGFRMTHRMDKFNKYNLWKRWSKDLARTMKESKDIEIHVMFNNPTSTSLTCGVGFDTLAIANTTHTGLADGTSDNYDNYLAAALSYSALESARYYFKTLKDDKGMLVGGTATHLVFEPTLYTTAFELTKSSGRPHEMSNTKNAFENAGFKLYEDPRLTSTTAWFMLDKKSPYFDFNVLTSEEPFMVTKDAPDNTLDRVAISHQMFTYGWGDARACYWGNT